MTTKIAIDRPIVERCFLMNLDRREDRLKEWMEQLPDPWPFPHPERFAAIDGRRVATPPQWRAGNGAWGCYRSHALILEKCLIERIDSYVVSVANIFMPASTRPTKSASTFTGRTT